MDTIIPPRTPPSEPSGSRDASGPTRPSPEPHPWTAPGGAEQSLPADPSDPSNPPSTADPSAERPHDPAAPEQGSDRLSASAPGRRVSWRSVIIFAAVAYGLFALCAAPFWVLEGGIAHPLYTLVIGGGMIAPTIASVVVAKLVDRTSWRDAVGLRFRGRWARILIWAPLAVLLLFGINLATALLMVLRGVPGDLTGSTWATEVSRSMTEQGAEMPTAAAVALVLAGTLVVTLVNVVPALGEEIGWRGWLWRELKPLGPLPAIVVGGAIWSLWHLPVTLIGHNYTGQPRWAAAAMFIPACIALNYLFVAITERAGGNPIPSAFAHSTFNSTLGLAIGIVATSDTAGALNWFLDTPMGLFGIVLVAAVAFLVMPRGRRHGDDPAQVVPTAAL